METKSTSKSIKPKFKINQYVKDLSTGFRLKIGKNAIGKIIKIYKNDDPFHYLILVNNKKITLPEFAIEKCTKK